MRLHPARAATIDVAVLAWIAARAAIAADGPDPGRAHLRASELRDGFAYTAPVPLQAFAAAPGARAARHRFEGRLTLQGTANAGSFVEHVDTYHVTDAADSAPKHLPEFSFELVQVGDVLVPARRGAIPGTHPYWEFVLEPGRVWQEAGDFGYSRAALPYSLQEVNANCTHNGVLTFLFKDDGSLSQVAYQVSSETCAYFKADLWGVLRATYAPHEVADRAVVERSFAREVAARLPRKPIAELARDHPGVDPGNFAHPDDVSPAHLTTFGVIVDGVHYAGGCPTRAGPHPYCADIDLPSYSIAKSTLAAVGLMRLERNHPGTRARIAADFVPECAANGTWRDVTFEHLLDMASGHHLDASDQGDEMAAHADALFFGKASHREKIGYACGHFPRKDQPGERWVYRTSDTYILGTAMTAYLSQLRGTPSDIVDDLVAPEVWDVMRLSPTAQVTRRTRDAVRQPFAGYGLTLRADDVALLASYLNPANVAHEHTLDPAMLRAALQLDPNDRGLPAAADGTLRYNNGFWAVRVAGLPGCREPQHVPFMSGFGGITVALMPNGVSYYYFSDNAEFRFRRAIVEAAHIRGYCQPDPVTSPPTEVASR